MPERDTRIRWTGKERDAVVREYQRLCASNAGLPMLELLVAAQKSLPLARQRPPSYALRAWFNKELKSAHDADVERALAGPGVKPNWRDSSTQATSAMAPTITALPGGNGTLKLQAPGPASSQSLEQTLAVALRAALCSPASSAEIQALVDAGVEIAAGILNNPRVRQAVRGLLEPPQDEPVAAPRATFQTSIAQVAKLKVAASEPLVPRTEPVVRSGKLRVLIAGPLRGQLTELRAPYEAKLELESWSPDQGFEQLRTLVDTVDVVIGMPSLLTQAVQNTLRHYAKRYVRHTGGTGGLGGELAKLLPGEVT